MNEPLELLEQILGYNFKNRGYLMEALVHTSYAHERGIKFSNERLELLGDAVIHLAITEFLIEEYPREDEGALSALRSFCESEPFLYEVAVLLDLGKFIRLGKGEQLGGGMYKESLLANTYEAVIASIHLDGGFKSSRRIVLEHLREGIRQAHDKRLFVDSKSELQKYTQKHHESLPKYAVVCENGADHEKIFTVRVSVKEPNGDIISAEGRGRNKKLAEKDAARKMMEKL